MAMIMMMMMMMMMMMCPSARTCVSLTEASLEGVDPLLRSLRRRVRRVDADILAAVRRQSHGGSKAKMDLASATSAIKELQERVIDIKVKAEQSEEMVQEICRDIKKLDFAKKNLTATVLSLRRISMLATAVDQLESLATNRQYRDAAGLFQAVGQLNDHLEKFSSIARVVTLRNRFLEIKMLFRSHIFEDFATLFALSAESSNLGGGDFKAGYEDACIVIDAMDGQVRDELINSICNRELSQYSKIFATTGDTAKLDRTERRYAWLMKMLKDKSMQLDVFPRSWCVQEKLCTSFCKITKAALASILDTADSSGDIDVTGLLSALKGTLAFEKELEERFGSDAGMTRGGSLDFDDDDDDGMDYETGAAAVRRKYEMKRRERERAEASANGTGVPEGEQYTYKGLISKVFDKHMKPYVALERQTLMQTMNGLVDDETWEVEDDDENNVLQSAPLLFQHIKKSLKRCSALTRGKTLVNLMRVFQDVLRAYASRLEGKLPKTGSSMSALQGGDWHVKITNDEETIMCLIVNTAAYCFETVGQLSENVEKLLGDEEDAQISVDGEEDAFSAVMTRSLSTLVLGIETNMEAVLKAMVKVDFGTMDSVGDQSDFVGLFSTTINGSFPGIAKVLGANDFRFVCDKFGASFPIRYTQTIFKCRRINETGAQQLLLDTHTLKTVLLELPAMGGLDASRSSYGKGITREMTKAEALLKVIQSPPDHAAAMYQALLPEGTITEFQAVLDLKGLKKSEHQALVDSLTGRNSKAKASAPAKAGMQSSQQSSSQQRQAQQQQLQSNRTSESKFATQAAAVAMSGRSMMQQTSGSFKKLGASVTKLGQSVGDGAEGAASAMRKGFSTKGFRKLFAAGSGGSGSSNGSSKS